jgi:transposase
MVMKVYSAEFKADAVALYLSDPKNTFEGVGKDLGISRETLRNWVRAERARKGHAAGTSGSPRAAQRGTPQSAPGISASRNSSAVSWSPTALPSA